MNDLELRDFTIGNNKPMTLMGGVNVLESRDLAMKVAEQFKLISDELGINYIFKGSFDKANRSSVSSFRGPGLEEGLKILKKYLLSLMYQLLLIFMNQIKLCLLARYVK